MGLRCESQQMSEGEVVTRFIQAGGTVQVFPPDNELTRTAVTPNGTEIHCYGVPLQVPRAIRQRQYEAREARKQAMKGEVTVLNRKRPKITKATIVPKPQPGAGNDINTGNILDSDNWGPRYFSHVNG